MTTTELRSFNITQEENTIKGYAIRFNEKSELLGNFIETIKPEALDNVDFSDTKLLYNHQANDILGRTSSGTLRLHKDQDGLYFEADLPDTTLGRDTLEMIKRNDLKGMSFSMTINEDTWDIKQSPVERNILSIGKVQEISIVIDPAYQTTSVSKRALDEAEQAEECYHCVAQNQREQDEIEKEAREILAQITD